MGLDDPRVEIRCEDGYTFLDGEEGAFDAILVDSIDPVGESAKLFTSPFYGKVREALRPGGSAVFQTESPFYNTDVVARVAGKLRPLFPHVTPYLAYVPTYPSGLWSFTCASLETDLRGAALRREPPFLGELKYFNAEVFRAATALPNYIRAQVGE